MFKRRKSFVPAPHLSAKKTVQLRRSTPGTPAAPIDMIKKVGVSFEKKVESAVNLNKNIQGDARGVRWSVIGLMDESYSMQPFFNDGTVQEIVERTLAWAASVDSDGMAPFGGFANGHVWHEDVDLSNVNGIVRSRGWQPWGMTNLAASLQAILDMIHQMGDGWQADPILLFIVTDGMPQNQGEVQRLIGELSQYPVFIKILRVGTDPGARQFVEFLDNMTGGRLIDNVEAPDDDLWRGMPDDVFNAAMINDMDKYIMDAKAAGLVTE